MDNDSLYALYLKHFSMARAGIVLDPQGMSGEYRETGAGPDRSGSTSKRVTYNNSELLAVAMGVSDGRGDKGAHLMWSKDALAEFIKKQLGEG